MQIFSKKQKGFTLIELLVVIAIIGILSSVVLVSLGGARAKARDAKRQSELRSIMTAQEMYYGVNGAYFKTAGTIGTTTTVPAITGYLGAMTDYAWAYNDVAITGCTAGEFFCAYVKLEGTGYYVASEKGVGTSATEPLYAAADCVCW
jgi:prepilin-type N-terminal cleavage/methylation domain-containing protein